MQKNRMKWISALLAATVLLSALAMTACNSGKDQPPEPEVDPIDDNFRTFYQIFVGSYSDSNGDGIGGARRVRAVWTLPKSSSEHSLK